MTRKKKSKKLDVGKILRQHATVKKDTNVKVRKLSGNKPGSRQQLSKRDNNSSKASTKLETSRKIGSKKKITLRTEDMLKQTELTSQPSLDIQKTDRKTEIENDSQLAKIIAKQEQGISLTQLEVNYFNDLMDEYHLLTNSEDEARNDEPAASEDDELLWQKFGQIDDNVND